MRTPSNSHPARWRWAAAAALAMPLFLAVVHYVGTPRLTRWVWSEQGPLELSHVIIPLFVMGLGLVTLGVKGRAATARKAGLGWLVVGIAGLALLCGVIAGEEASWGQHFLGWSTPDGWSELNDQQETNLHNIGSWADQKPRAIVELSVVLFGIVWPLLARWGTVCVRPSWRLILPPVSVLPIALLAEGVRMLERGPGLLGMPALAAFPRPSELQELYFYTFFALCMLSWRKRLLSRLALAAECENIARTNDDHPCVSPWARRATAVS